VIDPFVPWVPMVEAPSGAVRLAVKDVVDVAGLPTGAGHPLWLRTHPAPAERDAEVVARLRDAGAFVVGKTHTDELAYSLGGTNQHYGAPINAAAEGRVTGGSSSGSASAVALGAADVGLGTDTAGSIRVPASYCGLYGLRPTHARVSRTGVVPLAPSFDVPGLLTRDARLLRLASSFLEPAGDVAEIERVLRPDDLWESVDGAVRAALEPQIEVLNQPVERAPLFEDSGRWERTREAFAVVQGFEAWQTHGAWIEREQPEFGPGVGARFRAAREVTAAQADAGRAVLSETTTLLRERLRGAVLALPSTPGPAPRLGAAPDAGRRAALVRFTCLASAAGAPALSVPGAVVEGAPVGLSLVGVPGADERLMALAERHAAGALR
jgi:amidase